MTAAATQGPNKSGGLCYTSVPPRAGKKVEEDMYAAVTTGIRAVRERLRAELLSVLVLACWTATTEGQEEPLRLKNLSPAGARSNLTESWGVAGFRLSNTSNQDREARVLTYYAGAPGRQFGRDVWVPGNTTLS